MGDAKPFRPTRPSAAKQAAKEEARRFAGEQESELVPLKIMVHVDTRKALRRHVASMEDETDMRRFLLGLMHEAGVAVHASDLTPGDRRKRGKTE